MDTTEEKIINAAIQCIEKYGSAKVTNKLIGEEAGVNSAAISYYFRSKAKLMALAQEVALRNGFEWEDYAETDALGAKEQLAGVLTRLAAGALRFPNLTKSFFMDAYMNGDYSGAGIRKLNEFLALVCEKLCAKLPNARETDVRSVIHRAFNGAVLPMIAMPRLLAGFSEVDLSDAAVCERYIGDVIEALWSGLS